MATEPFGQWRGTEMDENDVDELLNSAGWGVLSLARDDEPYSIPVSFGYDGESVFFAFVRASPPNTKFDFIEDGATARLLVTDVRDTYDWQSVAVTGPVRAVRRREDLGGEDLLSEIDDRPDRRTERHREWAVLLDTLDENEWFSSEYERAEPVSELQGWWLDPDEIHGVEVRADAE
jgi:hypothetical protein